MKITLLAVFIVSLFSSVGHAQVYGARGEIGILTSGSFMVQDSSTGLKVGMDIAGDVKALNMFFDAEDNTHHFAAGFLSKEDGIKKGFALRGKYGYHFPLFQRDMAALRSETSFAAGILNANYLAQNGRSAQFQSNHILFGASQYFATRLEKGDHELVIRAGAENSGSKFSYVGSNLESIAEWDNYGYGIRSSILSRFSDKFRFLAETDAMQKRYNPSRYFFVEKWITDFGLRSGIIFSPDRRIDIIPSFNWRKVDIERNGRPDLERPEFGGAVVVNNIRSSGINASFRGIYAPWRHKRGGENLIALGISSTKYSVELYRRSIEDIYSSFMLKETLAGFQFVWNFSGSDDHKIKSVDDYGAVLKDKYRFYTDSGNRDDKSLSRIQQSERLNTIRKVTEWSGNNLKYINAGNGGFRDADEVYKLRGGDCDEQSCTAVSMNRFNSYKSYNLNYYDFNRGAVGHGVELVQDKTSGQWFLTEYGIPFKVNAAHDAGLEIVASEAVIQNYRYLALEIPDPSNVYYKVIDCSNPGTYRNVINFTRVGLMPNINSRPQIEYGFELFSKRNLLFEY